VNYSRRQTLALAAAALALPAAAHAQQTKTPTAAQIAQPHPLGDIVLGKADAPVTIIEYASMTCSHCANFANTTLPKLKELYVDTGKVRFIFREFPLDAASMAASVVARCAGKDDKAKTYAMIEALFAQQDKWAFKDQLLNLQALAKQFGMGEKAFEACFDEETTFKAIRTDAMRASEELGVNSTPTLFINGTAYPGAHSIEQLEKIIKPLLGG
jgi:protein-disulfide isomerase